MPSSSPPKELHLQPMVLSYGAGSFGRHGFDNFKGELRAAGCPTRRRPLFWRTRSVKIHRRCGNQRRRSSRTWRRVAPASSSDEAKFACQAPPLLASSFSMARTSSTPTRTALSAEASTVGESLFFKYRWISEREEKLTSGEQEFTGLLTFETARLKNPGGYALFASKLTVNGDLGIFIELQVCGHH